MAPKIQADASASDVTASAPVTDTAGGIPAAPAISGSRTFEEMEALARDNATREADKRQREAAESAAADQRAADKLAAERAKAERRQ